MSTHDAAGTAALLDFAELVDAVATAAGDVARGSIRCPDRLVVSLSDGATMLSMPAVADDIAIHKLITVVPGNAALGVSTIQGVVSVVDPVTGSRRMELDGPTVTGRRTAAVSLLAMRLLVATPVRRVLLIGTGSQATHHVDALAALHPDVALRVRGRTLEAATRFCAAQRAAFADLAVADEDEDEVPDVVVTCTTGATPVYREPARAGTLVIATGSFRPTIAEIAAETVRASAVCVDDPHGARTEAGDLLLAGVDWNAVTSMAALVGGAGRPAGPIVFKSVGCAAWDLAAARVALRAMR